MRIFVWFFILVGMAFITGFLVKWEPMISGSGIPQLEGEMTGKLDQRWYRIIPAKFIGGFRYVCPDWHWVEKDHPYNWGPWREREYQER